MHDVSRELRGHGGKWTKGGAAGIATISKASKDVERRKRAARSAAEDAGASLAPKAESAKAIVTKEAGAARPEVSIHDARQHGFREASDAAQESQGAAHAAESMAGGSAFEGKSLEELGSLLAAAKTAGDHKAAKQIHDIAQAQMKEWAEFAESAGTAHDHVKMITRLRAMDDVLAKSSFGKQVIALREKIVTEKMVARWNKLKEMTKDHAKELAAGLATSIALGLLAHLHGGIGDLSTINVAAIVAPLGAFLGAGAVDAIKEKLGEVVGDQVRGTAEKLVGKAPKVAVAPVLSRAKRLKAKAVVKPVAP